MQQLLEEENLTNQIIIPEKWQHFANLFKALGDEHRQKIIILLKKHKILNATDIAKHSILSRTTVSHHLKILTYANVVISKKKSKEVFYYLNKEYLEKSFSTILNFLDEDS